MQRRGGSVTSPTHRVGTMVVSPHSDDAALSMGGLLIDGALPTPLVLVTVFSSSSFAFREMVRFAPVVSRLRKAEDWRFAKRLDGELVNLGLADAPLRFPKIPLEDLVTAGDVDNDLVPVVTRRLATLLKSCRPEAVVGPVGYGGHIDHVTVRTAVEQLGHSHTSYYLDQPYAGLIRHSGLDSWSHRLGLEPRTNLLSYGTTPTKRSKIELARFYRSQPAARELVGVVGDASQHDIVESMWAHPLAR